MNSLSHRKKTTPLLLIIVVLACLGLLPEAQAVSPTPDGCYPNFTTAEGCDALNALTTGAGNTALGWHSLFLDSSGNFNTAVGGGALVLNNADSNTATGAAALLLNTAGTQNTAVGTDALVFNDSGSSNTAIGAFALFNSNADDNIAIGEGAGTNNETGSHNIYIGDVGGVSASNVISIGAFSTTSTRYTTCFIGGISGAEIPLLDSLPVYIDVFTGQLGTVLGPGNGNKSTAPVPRGAHPQAMLDPKLEKLQATVAQQQRQIEILTAQLREQAAQIRKVSAQLELSKAAPQTVLNSH